MAAKQDQGLMGALIAFVCLFVIFAAMSYLFYRSSSEAEQRATSLESQLRDKQGTANTLQTENESYRQMMGFGQFDNATDVQQSFDADMARFGSTFEESRRVYRTILEAIYEENDKITNRESAAKEQVKQLKERLLAVEAQKEAQVVQFEEQMKKAEEDAAEQRNGFARDRASLESTKQELQKTVESQRNKYEGQIAERDVTIKTTSGKLVKNMKALEKLIDERKTSTESFEVGDGRVVWVNQNGTLWVNLGSADALRRQITFSVYDTNLHDAAKAEKKGSIEITRILGDHMAEARITDDDARNPILSGDQIYSQIWHRGKKLRFALTGILDIDDDGRSDLQLARDLVELNGGAVDAYLDDNGTVEGSMTVSTRYLVLGKFPESTNQAALQEGFSKMSEEASTLGVEVIALDEFLNQMGYRAADRTVRLGPSARPGDFPPAPAPGAAARFRSRTPYRAPVTTPY